MKCFLIKMKDTQNFIHMDLHRNSTAFLSNIPYINSSNWVDFLTFSFHFLSAVTTQITQLITIIDKTIKTRGPQGKTWRMKTKSEQLISYTSLRLERMHKSTERFKVKRTDWILIFSWYRKRWIDHVWSEYSLIPLRWTKVVQNVRIRFMSTTSDQN